MKKETDEIIREREEKKRGELNKVSCLLKKNTTMQMLELDPSPFINLAIKSQGYSKSQKMLINNQFKQEQNEYLESPKNDQEEEKKPVKKKSKKDGQDENEKEVDSKKDENQMKNNLHRFVRNKDLLFQLSSPFLEQLNVCANIQFIEGFYKISFFVQYWLLNNTQLPLQLSFQQVTKYCFRYC